VGDKGGGGSGAGIPGTIGGGTCEVQTTRSSWRGVRYTLVGRGSSAVAIECGGMVTVGQRMGGEAAAWASDIHRKGMLEARLWSEEARLDSG
jgi:hypothetical protein